MNETISPAQAIEELQRLPENARKILGMIWLDEAAFYTNTVQLRLCLPDAFLFSDKSPFETP